MRIISNLGRFRAGLLGAAAFSMSSLAAIADEQAQDLSALLANRNIEFEIQNLMPTSADPVSAPNLSELVVNAGYDPNIQSLMPVVNWRDDLGNPSAVNFDSANAFAGIGFINMQGRTGSSQGFCSGTMINSRFFLTAAHCVRYSDPTRPAPADLTAVIEFSNQGAAFDDARAASIVTPSGYVPSNFSLGQDLALVALDRPVYNQPFRAIASTTPADGAAISFAGYGNAGTGSNPNQVFDGRRRDATNLNEGVFITQSGATGTVFVADFEDPLDTFNTDFFFTEVVTAREASVAPGDSGGPLLNAAGQVIGVASGVFTIGVNSWGYGALPFWTNLTEAQYQTFIANNNPLRIVNSTAAGSWGTGANWTGGVAPNNTFQNGQAIGSVADFSVGQRYYDVAVGHAITLSDTREVDSLLITANTLTVTGTVNSWAGITAQGSSGLVVNGTAGVIDSFFGKRVDMQGTSILSGTGTINANLRTQNTARVSPGGAAIGTLTVNGNYQQGATSIFDVQVTNGSADRLTVSGAASIAGTIQLNQLGAAPVKGQQFILLSGSGVSGTFTTVIDNLPGALNATLQYNPTNVTLRIGAQQFCVSAPNAPLCAFLDGLDGATTPAMQAQIQALQNLDPSEVARALAAINPSRVNGQATLGFQFADLIQAQLAHRSTELLAASTGGANTASLSTASKLADAGASADAVASAALAAMQSASMAPAHGKTGWSLFASGDIGETKTQNISGVDEASAQAFTAGADYSNGKGVIIGAAVSATDGEVDQNYGLGGTTKGDGFAVSGFAGLASEFASIDGYVSYGMTNYDTTRTVMPAPLTFVTARGETDSRILQIGGTLAAPLKLDQKWSDVTITAIGGLYFASLTIDGYTETGAGGWSAIIPDREYDSLKGLLGLEFARSFAFGSNILTPFVRVQANNEFAGDGVSFTGSFVAAPASTFVVAAPDLNELWGSVALGASARFSESATIYVRYQNEFDRGGQEGSTVSVAARVGF